MRSWKNIINRELKNQKIPEIELILLMMTLHLINHNQILERKAKEYLNCSYNSAFKDSRELKI